MSSSKITGWIINTIVTHTLENLDTRSFHSAARQLKEVEEAVEFLSGISAETNPGDHTPKDLLKLRNIIAEWNDKIERDIDNKGLSVLRQHGFTISPEQFDGVAIKDHPDRENAYYMIHNPLEHVEDMTPSEPQWHASLFIERQGISTEVTVKEPLTLPEILELYQELPLPSHGAAKQECYETWDGARGIQKLKF